MIVTVNTYPLSQNTHAVHSQQTPPPSTEPTNSPCPLAAALGYPTGSSPTDHLDNTQPMPSTSSTTQHVPSRWDTPLVNPSPGPSTVTSYRINTPTKPTSTRPHINLPPVVSDNPGIPRLDEAVDLLNELRTICEILLPGHGQFLCHFIYLYFLQHIQLP